MSVSDLSGRLLEPSTGLLQRLLSNRASTDCCNIRFSLRMMTSGALRSTSFLSRLLRLMMAIEIVQIARGEVPAIEQHQGAQIGRNHRDHVQDHPLWLIIRVADRFDG